MFVVSATNPVESKRLLRFLYKCPDHYVVFIVLHGAESLLQLLDVLLVLLAIDVAKHENTLGEPCDVTASCNILQGPDAAVFVLVAVRSKEDDAVVLLPEVVQ